MQQKKRVMIFISSLLLLLLAGCTTSQQDTTNKIQVSQDRRHKSSTNSNQDSSQDDEKATMKKQQPLWSATKNKALAAFMKDWQGKMGQTYQGTYEGHKANHGDFIFPDGLQNGHLTSKLLLNYQPFKPVWSTNGMADAEYQVVAAATGYANQNHNQYARITTYLFTLHNGRPLVLVSQSTNGDYLWLTDSQNVDLQVGFAKIVTGKTVNYRTDAWLNSDVTASLAQQQLPSAYRKTWYYFIPAGPTHARTGRYDGKIASLDLTKTTNLKLNQQGKWVQVSADDQVGQTSRSLYLRYRYYDGKQIPVLLVCDEAGKDYDFNMYPTLEQAHIMQNQTYGDEPEDLD